LPVLVELRKRELLVAFARLSHKENLADPASFEKQIFVPNHQKRIGRLVGLKSVSRRAARRSEQHRAAPRAVPSSIAPRREPFRVASRRAASRSE
jgi:hypothetical protein